MNDTLSALIEMDRQGFVLPPRVAPLSFGDTAREALDWARGVREELVKTGKAVVLDEMFSAGQLVPDELMAECFEPARATYGIDPTWVPAFFSRRLLPFYVGGATFYANGGSAFRMLLVLREPFRRKRRWLIYDRSEIAAHEACHVARAAMREPQFEEQIAYALSASRLRRRFGNVFRGRWEANVLLGSTVLLLVGTALEMAGYGARVKWASGVPLLAAGALLAARGESTSRLFRRARLYLRQLFGESANAALFRCTDEEIRSLAAAAKEGRPARDWLDERGDEMRWQIIRSRFLEG